MYQLTQTFEAVPANIKPFNRLEWIQTNTRPCLFINNRVVYFLAFRIQVIPSPEVDTTILIGVIPYPNVQIGVWDKNGNPLNMAGPMFTDEKTYNLLMHDEKGID